jgi:hypothetical protein
MASGSEPTNYNVSFICCLLDNFEIVEGSLYYFYHGVCGRKFGRGAAQQGCDLELWLFLEKLVQYTATNVACCSCSERCQLLYGNLRSTTDIKTLLAVIVKIFAITMISSLERGSESQFVVGEMAAREKL